jgi:DNA sulfur modification protein DndC
VIDDTTPSCGNSRFGCWVCTVVNKDKSMEGLIDNGEEWMLPLLEIRNFLIHTRDNPERYRERTRRDGKIHEKYWGPYKFETRVEILQRILKAQKEIQDSEGVELITHQEMVLIQYHWYRDGFFSNRVTDIYNGIFKENINLSKKAKRAKEEEDILRKVCIEVPKDVNLIQDLLTLQKTRMLLIRKRGLQFDIDRRIEQFMEEAVN